jgi:PAS domain S-box-containing protein
VKNARRKKTLRRALKRPHIAAGAPCERCRELDETLAAIRRGAVDALVVQRPEGEQIFTLQGADHPYRMLVEAMNEGAATVDADGTVLFANARLSEMLGVPLEKFIGSPLQNRIPSSESRLLADLIEAGLRSKVTGEVSFGDGFGRQRLLRLSLSPAKHADDEMACLVATDLTEIVEANRALKASEEGLRTLSAELLRSQDDERRRIARDLHDVTGQKIVSIAMLLSILDRYISNAGDNAPKRELAECAATVEEVGKEIRTLSYLLHPPLLEELGLLSAIRWFVGGFQYRSGIEVRVDVEPNLRRLPPDVEVALFRVIQEALTNVHRYSESPTAQILLKTENGRIRLEVTDQGKGIGQVSTAAGSSLGLGIQSMRERMRVFSGTLEIISPRRGGTRVIAELPIVDEALRPVVEPQPDLPAPVEITRSDGRRHAKRVMIADDHELLRRGVRNMLEASPEWEVCGEVGDGPDAVEKAIAEQPDLVIMDITMPGLNGLAATRQILASSPRTKILVFTTHEGEGVAGEVMAAGAHGYLPKSRLGADLISAMKSILEDRPFFFANSVTATA